MIPIQTTYTKTSSRFSCWFNSGKLKLSLKEILKFDIDVACQLDNLKKRFDAAELNDQIMSSADEIRLLSNKDNGKNPRIYRQQKSFYADLI